MTLIDYTTLPGINWTTLKEMRRSPLHYQHRLANPLEDSARLAMGRAAHTAILEPDRFPLEYAVWTGERRAGKEWEAFKAANAGRTIIKADEYATCLAMRDAVRRHPAAAAILQAGGEAEKAVTWTDDATGLPCKGRMDWLGKYVLADLKTTSDLDPVRFGATAARMGYHTQLAFYRRGVKAATGMDYPVQIIAVESSAPHDVAVFTIDETVLYAGDEEIDELLAKVKACREANAWPGRYPAETTLQLPNWAFGSDAAGADDLDLIVGEAA